MKNKNIDPVQFLKIEELSALENQHLKGGIKDDTLQVKCKCKCKCKEE